MKLKELLKGRDKLRKYDELKEWRDRFNSLQEDKVDFVCGLVHINNGTIRPLQDIYSMPSHIKQVIVDALESEIKKLDEE